MTYSFQDVELKSTMVKHPKKEDKKKAEKTSVDESAEETFEKAIQEDTETLLKRVQADFQNYRRRNEEEKADLRDYYTSSTFNKIIPIIDHFELALQHDCADKNYAMGMKMIYKLFIETLKNESVEQINPSGEMFDTKKHEAITTKHDLDAKENIVLDVLTKGYMMKGKMLRRARVVVNKKEE
jgi:molecular chaperone GrpE